MTGNVMLNVRIDAGLKSRGAQVLERNGISITEYVRRSFEALVEQQDIPPFMRESAESCYDKRRQLLKTFARRAASVGADETDTVSDSLELRHARADAKYKEYLA